MSFIKAGQIAVLGSVLSVSAALQPVFAQTAYKVCKSVAHCVDVLERHESDSFDYEVLASNFSRFSAKGRQALLKQAANNKTPRKARRALEIMALADFDWTPVEKANLIAAWPQNHPDLLTPILARFKSEAVRNRAITYLNHRDETIRALSRQLVSSAMIDGVTAPVPSVLNPQLAKALIDEPTLSLIDMAAQLPAENASVFLKPVLKSGDAELTRHAYQRLFDIEPKVAFNGLLTTLFSLRADDFQTALALSEMLRARHALRPDGFYLKFAGDIAKDAKLDPMERFVGLDALMRAKAPVKLEQNDVFFQTLKTGMEGFASLANAGQNEMGVPYTYLERFSEMQNVQTAQTWISVLKSGYGDALIVSSYAEFIARLGEVKSELSRTLVSQAMTQDYDFNLLNASHLAYAKQGFSGPQDKARRDQFTARLERFIRGHPVSQVRLGAIRAKTLLAASNPSQTALKVYRSIKQPSTKTKQRVNQSAQYCPVKPTDFREMSRGMPYFDPAQYKDGHPTRRSELRAATELREGWLAAYSRVDKTLEGGLFYFDNQTGQGLRVLGGNVRIIMPTQKLPLGQYSKSFWAISNPALTDKDAVNSTHLYRVDMTPQGAEASLHMVLPHPPQRIGRGPRGWLSVDFVPANRTNISPQAYNPPLTWAPDGTLRAFCTPTSVPNTNGAP